MRIEKYPDHHLTYCSNIHPGEEWEDHFYQLKNHLPELKKRLSPEQSFGVGLRLSAKAASKLRKPATLDSFSGWLKSEDLYLFTINGFPYGRFHGERVKDKVYVPDWSSKERLDYTIDLANILSVLLPADIDGSISTSPVSYKYWGRSELDNDGIFKTASLHLAQTAHEMALIEEEMKRELHLNIEPEPDCLIENSSETVRFFTNWLLPAGSDYLVKTFGYNRNDAVRILQKHIRVCYDTCHFALEYEEPKDVIDRFIDSGIRIGKTQVSAALKVPLDDAEKSRQHIASKLQRFDEPVYLHQVIELRTDGSYKQYRDLSDALPNIHDPAAQEWRIHFHVPVFIDHFDELQSTRDHIVEGLQPLMEKSGCRHFEIETYTWEVLPEHLKTDINNSIEREFRWTVGLIDTY